MIGPPSTANIELDHSLSDRTIATLFCIATWRQHEVRSWLHLAVPGTSAPRPDWPQILTFRGRCPTSGRLGPVRARVRTQVPPLADGEV
jgi:hypothetical protein